MDMPSEVEEQVKANHVMEWDPPTVMTAVRRWTCTRCGDAVLVNGDVVYGSATRSACL